MTREISMPLGIFVERRKVDHPWADDTWVPVDVVPGAGPVEGWAEIASGEGWTRYHAATLTLTLYRSDTEAYLVNLADAVPSIYVVLRAVEDEEGDFPYFVFDATASPYEAQDYLDSAEDIVEPVPMPPALMAWVEEFVNDHHIDVPFKKKVRDKQKTAEDKFGQEPIFERRKREQKRNSDEFQR